MATHSSILAWRIPWEEEPGGLQSMRSLGVGHDSQTKIDHSLPLDTQAGSALGMGWEESS